MLIARVFGLVTSSIPAYKTKSNINLVHQNGVEMEYALREKDDKQRQDLTEQQNLPSPIPDLNETTLLKLVTRSEEPVPTKSVDKVDPTVDKVKVHEMLKKN